MKFSSSRFILMFGLIGLFGSNVKSDLIDLIPFNSTTAFKLLKEFGVRSIKAYLTIKATVLNSTEYQKCSQNYRTLLNALHFGKDWALEAYDSWGKFKIAPEMAGSPSVCRHLSIPKNQELEMKFCYFEFGVIANHRVPLRIGFCLPSTCSPDLFHKFSKPINDALDVFSIRKFKMTLDYACKFKQNNMLEFTCLLIIFVISFLLLLVVLGTVYDYKYHTNPVQQQKILKSYQHDLSEVKTSVYYQNPKENDYLSFARRRQLANKNMRLREDRLQNTSAVAKRNPLEDSLFLKIIICFSAYTNARKLFAFQFGNRDFPLLHGLRSFCMMGVLFGHTIGLTMLADNPSVIPQMMNYSLANLYIMNIFTMNVFFTISGLIIGYSYCFLIASKKPPSLLKIFIARFLRISPTFWFCTILYWKSHPYFLQSRLNFPMEINAEHCDRAWWITLLYIQNFFQTQCLIPGWYLATDMQLYMMSIIIFYILKRSTRWTYIFCLAVITISMTTTFVVSVYKKVEVLFPQSDPLEKIKSMMNKEDYFSILYTQSWFRCNSYILGMLCGMKLYKTNFKITLRKSHVHLLWIVAFVLCVPIIPVLNKLQLSPVLSGLFLVYYGTFWSLGSCIMLLLCCSGHGRFLTNMLSWPGWAPVSRLSLAMYLTHFPIIQFLLYELDNLFHVTFANAILYTIVVFQLTFIASMILYLTVEKPFARLITIFLK